MPAAAKSPGEQPLMEPALKELLARVGLASQAPDFVARRFCSVKQLAKPPGLSEQDLGFLKPLQRRKFRAALADAAMHAAADEDADDDWAQAAAAATRRSRLTADDVPGFGDSGSTSSGSGDSLYVREALRRPSMNVDEVEVLGVEKVEVQADNQSNANKDDTLINSTVNDSESSMTSQSSSSSNVGSASSITMAAPDRADSRTTSVAVEQKSSSNFASRKKSNRRTGNSNNSRSSSSDTTSSNSNSSSDSSHQHHHDGGSGSSRGSGYAIDKLADEALAFAFAPERAVSTITTVFTPSSTSLEWQSKIAVEEVEVVMDEIQEDHSVSIMNALEERSIALLKRVLGTADPPASDIEALMQLAEATVKVPGESSNSSGATTGNLCVAAAAYCAQEGHGSGCWPNAPRARALWAKVDFGALCDFAAGKAALHATTSTQDAGSSSSTSNSSSSTSSSSSNEGTVVGDPGVPALPPIDSRNMPINFLARCAQFLVGVAWYTGAALLPEQCGGSGNDAGSGSSNSSPGGGNGSGGGLDPPTGVWWLRAAAGGDPSMVASAMASARAIPTTNSTSSSSSSAATASDETAIAVSKPAAPAPAEFAFVPLAWSWLGEACAAGVAGGGGGSGGGQDWTLAQQWFALAASRGVPDAMNGLGVCFERFCAVKKGPDGSYSRCSSSDSKAGPEEQTTRDAQAAAVSAAAWYWRAYEEGGVQAQRDAWANLAALQASHPEAVPHLPLNPDNDNDDDANASVSLGRVVVVNSDYGSDDPPMTPPSKATIASAAAAVEASLVSSSGEHFDSDALLLESSFVCCSAGVLGWRASMAHGDRHPKLRGDGVKAGQVVRGIVRQAPHPLQSSQQPYAKSNNRGSNGGNSAKSSSGEPFAWWLEVKVPGRTDDLVAYLPGAPASAPPGAWTNFKPSKVTTLAAVEIESQPSTPKAASAHVNASAATPPRSSHFSIDGESSTTRISTSSSSSSEGSNKYPMSLKECASAAASTIAARATAAAASLEQLAVSSAVNRILRSPPQLVSHDDLALVAAAAGAGPSSSMVPSSSVLLGSSNHASSKSSTKSSSDSRHSGPVGALVVSQPRPSRRPVSTRDPLARACWAYMLRFGHSLKVDLERASALWAAVDWAQLLQLAGGAEALTSKSTVDDNTKAPKSNSKNSEATAGSASRSEDTNSSGTSGDANAQYLIGSIYESGKPPLPTATPSGTPTPDKAAAVQWYRLAAAQSHPRAQHALGVCCFYGDGTQEDKAASVKWDTLAAAQGHAKAQYSLGVCYDNGEGVEQEDEEKAAEYYALAAEQVFEDYL